MRNPLVLLAALAGALCCKGPDARPSSAQSQQASDAAVTRLDSLVARLATLPGSLDLTWQFTGDNAVFTAIDALTDSGAIVDTAVARLASCLGRTELAATTLKSRPVPVGVVCYAALRRLAYHEEDDSTGGLTPYWPGDLEDPAVTISELRAAYDAWARVVRDRSYRTL
jgi:hypothetical protein